MEGVFFVMIIVLGIALWFWYFSLDKSRITDYLQERGGRVVSITWAPFGKGWFGEKNDRIYEVVYYDKAGNQHFATCKTSLWSGVYWTEDRITHGKSQWYDSVSPSNEPGRSIIGQIPKAPEEDDAEEIRRLRAGNVRLREQLAERPSWEASARSETCPACGAAVLPATARCPECQIDLQ